MTARNILYNVQSEYSICLTVGENTYVDRYPVGGGDVKDRLTRGLVFTESIPKEWGNSVQDVLGSMPAANTSIAPLTDEYRIQWRGLEYQVDICGVRNKGMGNEIVTTFDNRLPFYSGVMNGCPKSGNSFLFSFGSNEAIWNTEILSTLLLNGDSVDSTTISFSTVSPTLVRSTESIQIDVSRASLSAASSPITIAFDKVLTDLSLAVESSSETVTHNSFSFSQDSTTKISSSSTMDISIEIQNNTSNTQTVTITSSVPMDSMVWDFRYFYSGGTRATNFSIEPDSVIPEFGPYTSEVRWSNMGGVKTLTFTVSSLVAPRTLGVDEGSRGFIMFGAKLWVKSIVEKKARPTIGAFSVAPTTSPSDGVIGSYMWSNAAITSIELANTFDLSDGNLTISIDRNRVVFENGSVSLTLVINRGYVDPVNDDSKIAFAPLWVGQNKNVTPVRLSDVSFYCPSSINLFIVRNDGVVVPKANSFGDYVQNGQNNILSWFPVKTPQVLDDFSTVIFVSGTIGVITIDSGDASTVGGIISALAAIAGIPVKSIDPVLGAYPAAWLFRDQVTFRQALDTILPPLDSFPRIEDGELVVEKRALYSENYVREVDNDVDVVDANIMQDLPIDNYHELIVNYNKNWTVQESVEGYKNEFEQVSRNEDSVKYLDYPANTKKSASKSKTVDTCLKNVSSANDQLVILDREKREHLPTRFYLDNRSGDLANNTSVKLNSTLVSGGMFLSESKMLDSDRKRTFIQGVWYGR